MPIRINLKELFGSDPQGVTVDKINFNFNKLLELGVGLPGPKGLTGPQGSAGPIGLTGPQGNRGTLWFIGTGNPNSQTFTGLMDGDFYLNTTNSEIWQYNETAGTWSLLIDFGNIVNNYLISSGVAFVRGLGDASPDDDRFIVFPFRGNDSTAQVSDVLGGSSTNDILFLNNFNEKFNVVSIDNFPTSTNDLYNAIQKIFVDGTSGIPGRYHLELGSLYADSNGPNANLLSSLKHNIKVRHVVDDLGGSPNYPSSNPYLYVGRISLSKTELQSTSELDFNSAFEFITSKYNNEGPSAINRELTVRLGSAEAIGEYLGSIADGINISLSNSEGSVELGIVRDFASNNLEIDGGNYALINHDANLDGVMIPNTVYQDGGNIEQIGSEGSQIINSQDISFGINPLTSAENVFHNLGIASYGNRLYTVDGVTPEGADASSAFGSWSGQALTSTSLKGTIYQWNIQDEAPEYNIYGLANNGVSSTASMAGSSWITGAGLCDIAVDGRYAYIVHNQVNMHLIESSGGGTHYRQTNLQIVDLNNTGQLSQRVNPKSSAYNAAGLDGLLDGAWRIKLAGDSVIIGTNKSRSWGSFYTDTFNTINEDCQLVIVDVSNPISPIFGTSEDSYTLAKSHVLDMEVYEHYVITVELKFLGLTTSGKGGVYQAAGGHEVSLNIYDITRTNNTGVRSIIKRASSVIFTDTLTAIGSNNYGSQTILNKVATVSTDGKAIFVSYIDKTYIYKLDDVNFSTGKIPTTPSIPLIATLTYTSRTGGVKTYDSKIAGNSLYLLNGSSASGVNDQQFRSDTVYLTKINISNKSSCYVEWEETVTNGGTRFEIVGNKAYIASQTFPNGSNYRHGIITFELDGIKSDHANISNLRSDKAKVMMDLEVGNSAKVYGSLNVGEGANFGGSLSALGEIKSNTAIEICQGGVVRTKINQSEILINDSNGNNKVKIDSNEFTLIDNAGKIELKNTAGSMRVKLSHFTGPDYSVLEFSNGGYFLSSFASDNLNFGALSGGVNFELVVVNAGNSLTNISTDNGVQIRRSLDVGNLLRVAQTTGTGVALYRNASTGILASTSSDVRLKDNVETIESALDKVLQLRGVYFNWKEAEGFDPGDDTGRQIGLIAQEVEEVIPEVVIPNGVMDYKTIRYAEMVGVLVEAIKEQQEQIEFLKDEIAFLKGTSPE